jgi:hypothetical protein
MTIKPGNNYLFIHRCGVTEPRVVRILSDSGTVLGFPYKIKCRNGLTGIVAADELHPLPRDKKGRFVKFNA